MDTTITGFGAGDVAALVDLWCRAAPADPITVQRFRDLVLLDVNFDPDGLKLAWLGGESDRALVGAAYAVRRTTAAVGADLEPHTGWVPFFVVAPEARGSGVGRAVLGAALDWLRGHGATEAFFSSYTPNYILPGLDRVAYPAAGKLLESFGFTTRYTAAAMDRGLVGYAIPDEVRSRIADFEKQGWSFGAPTDGELVPLVRLAGEHFNHDWARGIRQAVTGGLPLDRIVVARDPGGTIVGWAMHAAYEQALERFGPFGVLDSQRGLGLGTVLLHLTLERMAAQGAHSAWFLWTGESGPAGRLYLRTGFEVTRRFDVMRAEL
jgi:GNAT superfamily N-acetyltransferase